MYQYVHTHELVRVMVRGGEGGGALGIEEGELGGDGVIFGGVSESGDGGDGDGEA